jgi:hypothetical protein
MVMDVLTSILRIVDKYLLPRGDISFAHLRGIRFQIGDVLKHVPIVVINDDIINSCGRNFATNIL